MLNIRFIFRDAGRALAECDEITVLMPAPPRRGEIIEHADKTYRVEDVRYEVGKTYEPVRAIVECYDVVAIKSTDGR